MSWQVYAILSILFFTLVNLLQRKIAVDTPSPRVTGLLFNVIGAAVAVLFFIAVGSWQHFTLPIKPVAWLFVLGAVCGYGIFERGRFYVAKALDASLLSIIL